MVHTAFTFTDPPPLQQTLIFALFSIYSQYPFTSRWKSTYHDAIH